MVVGFLNVLLNKKIKKIWEQDQFLCKYMINDVGVDSDDG